MAAGGYGRTYYKSDTKWNRTAGLSGAGFSSGIFLWGILLKYNPVSRVTVFGFMNPVFGVLLSALLLGETDQASGILGLLSLLLVSVGIYVVNSGK